MYQVLLNNSRIFPFWQILFLFLFVCFEKYKPFLFLFVHNSAPQIYSYFRDLKKIKKIKKIKIFAEHWVIAHHCM